MTRPAKPAHGAPCNSCGECCRASVCPLGQAVLAAPAAGPCLALVEHADGTSGCGLVETPRRFVALRAWQSTDQQLRDAALLLIGSGHGCDAALNDEPLNLEFSARMARVARKMVPTLRNALARTWGVS